MTTGRLSSTFRVLAVAMSLAALPVMASSKPAVRVTVPFAFEAGEHAMPAGEYTVEQPASGGAIYITAPDGERRALMTFPAGNPSQPKSPRLVFERFGGSYRLAEVWAAGASTGAALPMTRSQMLVAEHGRRERVEIALARR